MNTLGGVAQDPSSGTPAIIEAPSLEFCSILQLSGERAPGFPIINTARRTSRRCDEPWLGRNEGPGDLPTRSLETAPHKPGLRDKYARKQVHMYRPTNTLTFLKNPCKIDTDPLECLALRFMD